MPKYITASNITAIYLCNVFTHNSKKILFLNFYQKFFNSKDITTRCISSRKVQSYCIRVLTFYQELPYISADHGKNFFKAAIICTEVTQKL